MIKDKIKKWKQYRRGVRMIKDKMEVSPCKAFGHKAVQPFPGMPVFCQRCKEDLSLNNGKWVVDDDAFNKLFLSEIEKAKGVK